MSIADEILLAVVSGTSGEVNSSFPGAGLMRTWWDWVSALVRAVCTSAWLGR